MTSKITPPKAGNFRKTIRDKKKLTKWVMLLFFTMCLSIGAFLEFIFIFVTMSGEGVGVGIVAALDFVFSIHPMHFGIYGAVAHSSYIMLKVSWFSESIVFSGVEHHDISRASENEDPKITKFRNVAEEMFIAARVKIKPKLHIMNTAVPNAFASGANKKTAVITVTQGLLDMLDRDELQAVVAHELAHIQHEDVQLTILTSSLSNAMLMQLDVVLEMLSHSRRQNNLLALVLVMLVRVVVKLLALVLSSFLSRTREYMADAGAVEMTRQSEPLARALVKIEEFYSSVGARINDLDPHNDARKVAYLHLPGKELFATHPNLEDRLASIGLSAKILLEEERQETKMATYQKVTAKKEDLKAETDAQKKLEQLQMLGTLGRDTNASKK